MKDRIFPSWSEIEKLHNPLTEGERRLACFLDSVLPEEWKIFVQPFLNGSRPDIIIFNPKVGLMIFEVKDWDLDVYRIEDKNLLVCSSSNWYEVGSPFDKVRFYRRLLADILFPLLGKVMGRDRRAYGIIKEAVYFHKVKGNKARGFWRALQNKSRYPLVLGYDDLHVSNLKNVVPDYTRQHSRYFKKEWENEILFWLKPPYHEKERTNPLRLNKEQQKHGEPTPGHHRLRGPTGSGKSFVIAYRAAKLASMGHKVLVVTFNITLGHYIRDLIQRAPFDFKWENIKIIHFHGFCNELINKLELPPPGDFLRDVPRVIVEKIEESSYKNKIKKDYLFDAILIDEGQDFEWEWYKFLCKFLSDRDELLLACDKAQNIYKRKLDWIYNMKGTKFRGRWGELKTIYRFPLKIARFANSFSKTFNIYQDVVYEKVVPLFDQPDIIEWRNINYKDWLQEVYVAFNEIKEILKKKGKGHPSDIVILLSSHNEGLMAVEFFEKINIEVNHVFQRRAGITQKISFYPGDSRLKMCTIHSFKGWEAQHVILLIPKEWKENENLDALIYTAITRTQKNLIVLNCNKRYHSFGESLRKV